MVMYAIGELIVSAIKKSGMSRREVVEALGYQNINRGLRRLDRLIQENSCNNRFLTHLIDVLKIPPNEMKQAITKTNEKVHRERKETRIKREQYLREHFRPYLYVKSEERRPRQISIVAFVGIAPFKHVPLPGIEHAKDQKEELQIVRAAIRNHYEEHQGRCPMFGRTTGYIYRRTFDQSIEMTIDGYVVELIPGPVPEPKVFMSVGGQKIEGGMLHFMDQSNNEDDQC
jgi:hypothetical protein